MRGDNGGILTPARSGDIPLGMGDTALGAGDVPLWAGETLLAGDTPLCGLPTEIFEKHHRKVTTIVTTASMCTHWRN